MGRMMAVRNENRIEKLRSNLSRFGLREPTIRSVVNVYEKRGAGAAIVELYKKGYRIAYGEEDDVVRIVKDPTAEIDEAEIEQSWEESK